MTSKVFNAISTATLALVLGACAPQTEVVKLYDSVDRDRSFGHFLVIGITGDADTRVRLEDQIARNLRNDGATATPGHTRTGSATTLLQAEIDRAAESAGADAILVTHIVSVDTTAGIEEGRVDIRSECRGGDPADYFLYDYDELKEPDTVRLAHTVVAVTNLYDAGNGERLWTIQSTCFEKSTMDEVLAEEAKAIARQLRIDGLIAR